MLFKNLQTERLYLDNISSNDREFILSQFSDDVINKYLFDAEPMTDISEADELIEFYTQPEPRIQHRWIIKRKSDNVKMGTCGFHCWNTKTGVVEVGYDLREEFWGNGYMTEAMKQIIEFAKNDMQVNKICACISVDNEKSIHLATKLGFNVYDTDTLVFRGKEYLHNIYTLILK